MVLGSLREQLLYPTWTVSADSDDAPSSAAAPAVSRDDNSDRGELSGDSSSSVVRPPPSDAELAEVLRQVRLGSLLARCEEAAPGAAPLDFVADFAGMLSQGEQQRLAFARLLLAGPRLALLDEATSALDSANETLLYEVGALPCLAAHCTGRIRGAETGPTIPIRLGRPTTLISR